MPDMVTDVTDATYVTEILERSEQVPVVVDLWAEWCGPCRTLGPIIEKVVDETQGEVVLVKVDTESNPGLSQMFQVQSIPAVFAVKDRAVVSSFVGAMPEGQVRKWVQSLLPSEADLAVARLMEAGDEASLLAALDEIPGHPGAVVALAELYVAEDRMDESLAMLDKIPESAETRRVAALARTGTAVADPTEDPLAGVDVTAKLDALLPTVKDDEAARQEYLDLLELMGSTDPRTVEYRRALSRQLF